MIGTVEKVEGDHVFIRPDVEDLQNVISSFSPVTMQELFQFNSSELSKYFHVGNHVQVTNGIHSGVTGFVVQSEGPHLTLMTDVNNQQVRTQELLLISQIRVFSTDVQISKELRGAIASVGNFELYDFVQLELDCLLLS
jgi:transcription elongation factor